MDGQTDGEMGNNVALTHPYHAGKSCSKFGKIPFRRRQRDGQTNRETDGQTYEQTEK